MTEQTVTDTKEAMIEAACAWWGREMGVFHDMNREASLGMDGFAVAMMVLVAPKPNASAAQKVVDALRVELRARAERGAWTSFGVDYGPEGVLYDAIKAAGSPHVSLPFKTNMWMNWDKGTVSVSKGYRAESVTIYPTHESEA